MNSYYQNLNTHHSFFPLNNGNCFKEIRNCCCCSKNSTKNAFNEMCNSLNHAQTLSVIHENTVLQCSAETGKNELGINSSIISTRARSSNESISEICELQIMKDGDYSTSVISLNSSKEGLNIKNEKKKKSYEENMTNNEGVGKIIYGNNEKSVKFIEKCKTNNVIVRVKDGHYFICNEYTHRVPVNKKLNSENKEKLLNNTAEREKEKKFDLTLSIESDKEVSEGKNGSDQSIIKLQSLVNENIAKILVNITNYNNNKGTAVKNHEKLMEPTGIQGSSERIPKDLKGAEKEIEDIRIKGTNGPMTRNLIEDIIELYKNSENQTENLSIHNASLSGLTTQKKCMDKRIINSETKICREDVSDSFVNNVSQYKGVEEIERIETSYGYGMYPEVYQKRAHTNLNKKLLLQIEMNDSFISFQKMMNPQNFRKNKSHMRSNNKPDSRTLLHKNKISKNILAYTQKKSNDSQNISFSSLKNDSVSKCSTNMSSKTNCLKKFQQSLEALKAKSVILKKQDRNRLKKMKNNRRGVSLETLRTKSMILQKQNQYRLKKMNSDHRQETQKHTNNLDKLTIDDLQPIVSEYPCKYRYEGTKKNARNSFLSKLLHDPSEKVLVKLLRPTTDNSSHGSTCFKRLEYNSASDENRNAILGISCPSDCFLRIVSKFNYDKKRNEEIAKSKVQDKTKVPVQKRENLTKNKLILNLRHEANCENLSFNTPDLITVSKKGIKVGRKESVGHMNIQRSNYTTHKTEGIDCTEKNAIKKGKGNKKENMKRSYEGEDLSKKKLPKTIDQRKLWSQKYGKSVGKQLVQFIEHQPVIQQRQFEKYMQPLIKKSNIMKNKGSQKELETISPNKTFLNKKISFIHKMAPNISENVAQKMITECELYNKKMNRFQYITTMEREIATAFTNIKRNRCNRNTPRVTTPLRLQNMRKDLETISEELLTLLQNILASTINGPIV